MICLQNSYDNYAIIFIGEKTQRIKKYDFALAKLA